MTRYRYVIGVDRLGLLDWKWSVTRYVVSGDVLLHADGIYAGRSLTERRARRTAERFRDALMVER